MSEIDYPYVNVALPIPGASVYSYAVPEGMRALLQVGHRVLVPLRGRQVTGVVVERAVDAPAHALKPISDVLDEIPLLAPGQMAFLEWLARYYKASLGEVLRAALPSGIEQEELRYAEITDEGRRTAASYEHDGLGHRGEIRLALLAQLARAGTESCRSLLKREGRASTTDLLALERRQLLSLAYRFKKGLVSEKEEQLLSLVARPDGKLSAAQEAIISLLEERKEITRTEFRRHFPKRADTMKRLIERGAVAVTHTRVFRDPFQGEAVIPHDAPQLTDNQRAVLETIVGLPERQFSPVLLHGVTGSGKTEIYLRMVQQVIQRGGCALLLVPEISLTPQLAARVRGRFGDQVALLHSGLGRGIRYDQWMRIRSGAVKIVLGARSALFAPLEHLGVIIVDEEHDGSFKQEEAPRYHARDCALMLGKLKGCPVILGSATPALESYHNALAGRYRLLTMPHRVTPQPLPQVEVVDLRGLTPGEDSDPYRFLVSPQLEAAIRQVLAGREQALLFLNRRGFATVLLCKLCGHTVECNNCSIAMTYHQRKGCLVCHYCDERRAIPETCPKCQSPHMGRLGFGTERIESICQRLFPEARIARMDRDTTRGKQLRTLLDDFRDKKIDLLIGTQMLAKGHDFPGVTLVGVIAADTGLNFPDFRAGERTFQLLTQVAGRAGRGKKPGRVLIQTYSAEHYVLRHALSHDFEGFFAREIAHRREANYPPFSYLAMIRLSGDNARDVEEEARRIASALSQIVDPQQLRVMGPAVAPIERLRGQTRWQLLLKARKRSALHQALDHLLASHRTPAAVRIVIDIDPSDMM